ncbi:phospholipase (plasmid) [Streptomyces xanthophaeus]|nr:phospholipase [Streptomyces xanthophaeus]WST65965.1 phospholipase [Streptomyces xanthophaeus]
MVAGTSPSPGSALPWPRLWGGVRDACARHDFLSRNYRDMYGETAFRNNSDGQKQIDSILGQDLRETCKNRYPGSQQLCEGTAHTYYKVVSATSAVSKFNPLGLVKDLGIRPPGLR